MSKSSFYPIPTPPLSPSDLKNIVLSLGTIEVGQNKKDDYPRIS